MSNWNEEPCAVYSCTIKFVDNDEVKKVLISEKDGLPEGYEDEDIFFHGLSANDITRHMMMRSPVNKEFHIIGLHAKPASVSSRWRTIDV